MYNIKLRDYKRINNSGDLTVDMILIQIAEKILINVINDERKKNKRKKFDFSKVNLERCISVSDIDLDMKKYFEHYIFTDDAKMPRKLSDYIFNYCYGAAMRAIYKHMDIFIDLDTSLDFVFSVFREAKKDSNIRKQITVTKHYLGRGFNSYNFKTDVTIREMFTMIKQTSCFDIIKIRNNTYYTLYLTITNNMLPYIGFRGCSNMCLVVLSYVMKKLSYVFYGEAIRAAMDDVDIYKLRKRIVTNPRRGNKSIEDLGVYGYETFKGILSLLK